MARKKRRSSKFRDSSTVIDMDQARSQRRSRQQERVREREAQQAREQEKQQRKEAARAARNSRTGRLRTFAPRRPDTPSGERQDRRKVALRRRQNQRRAAALIVAAVIIVVLGFSAGRILVLKHDLHTAQKEQEQYLDEKAQLEKDLKEIDDLQNLEDQARDQMRLIKPGETLYIFPEDMTQQDAGEDGEDKDKEDNNEDKAKE